MSTNCLQSGSNPRRTSLNWQLVQNAHTYDWIVFSSPNGVTAFFEMYDRLYDDAREIGGARIAAVGPATAPGCAISGCMSTCNPSNLSRRG